MNPLFEYVQHTTRKHKSRSDRFLLCHFRPIFFLPHFCILEWVLKRLFKNRWRKRLILGDTCYSCHHEHVGLHQIGRTNSETLWTHTLFPGNYNTKISKLFLQITVIPTKKGDSDEKISLFSCFCDSENLLSQRTEINIWNFGCDEKIFKWDNFFSKLLHFCQK